MKIFCIGLSRTGTTTLCNVLNELGYNAIHLPLQLFVCPELISKKYSFRIKNNLLEFQKKRLYKQIEHFKNMKDNIFNKYDAFGDLPIPLFYKDLDKKFPDSKFIYTFRDENKWLQSIKWNVTDGVVLWNIDFLQEELLTQTYGSRKFDSNKYLSSYRNHHKDVLEYFQSEKKYEDTPDSRLLSINLDNGEMNYQRICKFLNINVRKGRINKTNERKKINITNKILYYMKRNIPYALEMYNYLKNII